MFNGGCELPEGAVIFRDEEEGIVAEAPLSVCVMEDSSAAGAFAGEVDLSEGV